MKNMKVKTRLLCMVGIAIIMLMIVESLAYYGMEQLHSKAMDTLEQKVRDDYDMKLQEQVETAISMLDKYNEKYESGELTLEESKEQAADMLRGLQFGEGGYFWADERDGTNVVLLGSDTEGTNRMDAKDANGVAYMQKIISAGLDGGGFSDYSFPKKGETQASPKRGYSLLYEPFDWVIGTGNYTDDIDTLVAQEQESITSVENKYLAAIFIPSIILLVVLIIVAIRSIRNILGALNHAIHISGELGKGNMTIRSGEKNMNRKDEFGDLFRAMDQMADDISDVLVGVKNGSHSLAEAVEKVVGDVNSLNDGISNVSATTEELSASMEETAASIQQVDDMSRDIVDVSQNMSDKALEGTKKANEIHSRAALAKSDTMTKQQRVNEIEKEISQELQKALEGAKVVTQIEKLTDSIMSITSQTNLLALNASIESARAGEAGKGFAVVATEIQSLADQSKSSVEQIQNLTVEVTKAVETLSNDAQKLLDFVVSDVENSFVGFIEIADKYDADATFVHELVDDFNEKSSQLLGAISDIVQSIEGVSTATEESARGITEIAERGSDMICNSGEVLDAIRKTEETANILRSSIEKFQFE